MRKFETLKIYAELAWAGYRGFLEPDTKGKLETTSAQRDNFSKNFIKIKSSEEKSLSGFQATLYKNIKTGEYILSVRGTEVDQGIDQMKKDAFEADGDLALKSLPSSQVGDMVQFISGLIKKNNNNPPIIKQEDNIAIVGHSLGGTLAQVASKMYPGLFDKCYTFNSPSGQGLWHTKIYKDDSEQNNIRYFCYIKEDGEIKKVVYLDKNIGEAFYNYQNSPMTTPVTDVRAKDYFNVISNLWWKERFGELIEVSGESHSSVDLTKILYFYDEMTKNGVGEKDITNYLSGFYKNVSVLFNNNNSVEYVATQTLNAINKIVNGNNAEQKDIIDMVIDFEKNDTKFSINLLHKDSPVNSFFPNSSIPISALYSLIHLNPFIVSGADFSAYKELEKYKDEYSDNYIKDKADMFKKALDGGAAINGTYFKDYETNLILDSRELDNGAEDFIGIYREYHFGTNLNDTIETIKTETDLKQNHIYSLAGDDNIKIVGGSAYIEAGSGNDTIDLRGSKGENTVYGGVNNGKDNDDDGDDTIYAGQGKDTIYGGNGKDTIYTDNDDKEDLLYGGTGFDTYYVGDKDIIFDSDSKGRVVFEGVELKGGTYDKDKGAYVSKDGLIEYRLNESGDKSTLTVQKDGKSITINEFSKEDKSLGVELYGGKITVSISDSSAIESAQTMKFDISLDRKLEGDEYIILRVNDKKYLFGTPPKDGNINEDMFDSISSDGKTIVYNYEWKNDEIPQGDRDFIVAPVVEGVSDNLTVNSINPAKGTIKDDDRKPDHNDDPEVEASPIIIDLNKDGTATSKLNGAVNFDIDSNGFKEATGWISKDDAFLAYDRNGNGKIDNGNELFGDKTVSVGAYGYTGETAKNGFEALKEFDFNNDNIIDEKDKDFDKLLLWQDLNTNGLTEEGELKSLKEHNVKSIDLRYKETQIDNNGNLIKQTSTVTFNDNTTTTADDVWFKVDLKDTEQPDMDLSLDIKALPEVYAFGNIYNLRNAMSMDNGLADAVRGYIALNQETREKQLDSLIFKWAGAENLDINSRGEHIDARVLAVYEKMTGKPFLQWGTNPNPRPGAASNIVSKFNQFKDYAYASIELQTTYKGLIDTKYQYYDYDANKYGYDFSKVNNKIRELYNEQKYEEIAKINGLIKQAATYRDNLLTSFEENLIKLAGDSEHFGHIAMSRYIKGTDRDDTIKGYNTNDWIEGGKGNDIINGSDGDEVYVYSKGDGNDIIYDTRGTNKIKFKDITKNEVDFLRENNSLVIKIKDINEKTTIYDFFNHSTQANISIFEFADGNTTMANEIRAFNLIGDDGDNSIHGFVSDDTLKGNKGNDKLYGGWGNDTYVFNKGDGKDIIEDSSGLDAIKFENGINPEDVLLTRELGKLIINIVDKDKNSTGDSITVENFFSSREIESGAIENIIFSTGEKWGINKILEKAALAATNHKDTLYLTSKDDVFDALGGDDEIHGGYGNDTLYGNEGNDVLHGDMDDDTLIGGRGNDQLYGESGDDMYIFGRNWGNDTIIENYYDRNNIIKFTDNITKKDLVFNRNDRDLIISDKAGVNSICVKDVFYLSYDYTQLNSKISKIVFADGSEILEKDFIDPLLINPTDNDDKLVGAFDANYTIDGKGGNDTIVTNKGDDTLIGGKGNDKLIGGEGDDTYVYNKGDGNDIIRDLNGNNTICFKDIGRDGIEFLKNNNDLIIKIKESNETITIKDVLHSYQRDYVNFAFKFMDESIMSIQDVQFSLAGDDENNVLMGYATSDTIYGKKGNDTIYGGAGNDTYIYYKGDGNDTIYDFQGNNTIEFKDLNKDEIIFTEDQGGLLVKIRDTNEQITIMNFFNSESSSMSFKFADGTTLDENGAKATTFIGDNNNNTIHGLDSDDILKGNGGNDTIYGGKGDDDIEGGTGNDILVGNTGVDTYVFGRGDGKDVIYALDADYGRFNIDDKGNYNISYYYNQQNVKGTDIIKFKEGISKNDLIFERAGANGHDLLIKIKDTDDSITVKDMFSDTVSSRGIDKIEFADGSFMSTDDIYKNTPLVINRADQKQATGSVYSDTIIGNDQDNIVYANNGDDTLTGGKGNDYLDGGNGSDVYIYNKGDGNDTIYDANGTDTIKFGSGISKQDIIVKRTNVENAWDYRNITISFKNSPNDSITILDVSTDNVTKDSNIIETFEFENGERLSFEDIKKLSLIGTEGSENIIGYVHANNIIKGGGGDDKLYGQEGNDTIDGGEGDDIIEGGSGNDTLIGGAGNDTLNGGIGDDVYVYNKGDGNDTIVDTGGTDIIKFGQGINKEDLVATKSGDEHYKDITLTFKNSPSDSIVIKEVFIGENIKANNKIETLEFANGERLKIEDIKLNIIGSKENDDIRGHNDFSNIIKGNGGDDTLYGGDGNDIIEGGSGNDTLYGGDGEDTYAFARGDGQDTIVYSDGKDIIKFKSGIAKDDLIFKRITPSNLEDNLMIRIKDTKDSILIKNMFDKEDGSSGVKGLKFDDGSFMSFNEIRQKALMTPIEGDGLVYGFGSDDTIMGGDGDNQIYGKSGNDTLYGGKGNDELHGEADDDTLYGGEGNDILSGGSGNDTLYGGEGNDTLYGGEGADTYVLGKGDGNDKVYSDENDTIKLKDGIARDDINIQKLNDRNLKVSIKQTGDSVTVYDIFNQDYPSKIGKIEFSDGSFIDFESIKQIASDNTVYYADDNNNRLDGSDKNDIMYGNKDTNYIHAGAGDDILIGGEGNDELYGEWGADTYIFGRGDGQDTIYADGEDIIKFKEGITRDDILITRDYNDLVIKLKDSDDSVRVSYMLYGSDDDSNDNPAGIKAIEFSDGSSLGLEYIRKIALANENSMFQGDNVYGFSSDDIINGSAERETINARSGNDVIDGKGGNDTIIGGKGDDTLIGGEGDDIYEYYLGDGSDTIDNTGGGNDTLLFAYDISKNSISYKKDNNDLLMTINNDPSQAVRIKNHFLGGDYAIDRIEFGQDGSYADQEYILKQINAVRLSSQGGNNYLSDKDKKDNVYTYTGGKVTISDNGGDDRVVFKLDNPGDGLFYLSNGRDLKISTNKIDASNNDVLEIKNFFVNRSSIIENFDINDHWSVTAESIYEQYGKTFPPETPGTPPSNPGGSDESSLTGGSEDNVFNYKGGMVSITDTGGNDKVIFAKQGSNVFYSSDGINLKISTSKINSSNKDVLEVKNFFSDKNAIIEEFQISDYWTVTAESIYRAFGKTYPTNTDTQNAPLALLGTPNNTNEAGLNDNNASDT